MSAEDALDYEFNHWLDIQKELGYSTKRDYFDAWFGGDRDMLHKIENRFLETRPDLKGIFHLA
jgi:hypothetical protein